MSELTLDRLSGKVLAALDLETVFVASRCVIAAEKLLLFRKLHGRELSAAAIGRRARLHPRYCQSFLDLLVSLGLLRKRGGLYRNSPLARKHFVRERSVAWSRFWSNECARDYEALAVVEEVLASGRDWRRLLGRERKPDYELVREDPQWAGAFTHALHDAHEEDAGTLARHLDLSAHRALLDVGGGSGVMSIALARAHPHLRACILDFEHVCAAARSIIRRARLTRRIGTRVGDMRKSIPAGFDVILFWDIGFIETRVMRMAYESLPEGGLVVVSCFPSDGRRTPSPDRFVREYMSVRPKGQARPDRIMSLRDAGFRSVRYRSLGRGLGMITGRKKR